MKPIYKPTLIFTIASLAAMAMPSLGSTVTLADASIVTSAAQCETQTCGGSTHAASYNGPLSGFPGPEVVGLGASIGATGFPFPTLTSQVPGSGANADLMAQLSYLIEVVPIGGGSSTSPVELGVSATGSASLATSSGTFLSNNGNSLLGLALLSNSSGTAVFSDSVTINYSASTNNDGSCNVQNNSRTNGLGVIASGGVVSCGASSMSGGFTESTSYTVLANTAYEVVMTANLALGTSNNGLAQGPGSVSGTVFVDPLFTVPNGFQLILSPGVGNSAITSGVPEPKTWATLAVGLGILFAINVRRITRSNRAAAPAL